MDTVKAEQYYGQQKARLEWTVPEDSDRIGDDGYYMVTLDEYRLALKTSVNHLTTVSLSADTVYGFSVDAYDAQGILCDSTGSDSFYMVDYVAPVTGDFSVAQLPNGDGFRFTFTGYSDNVSVDSYVIYVNGEEDTWIYADDIETDEHGVSTGDAYLYIEELGRYEISVVAQDANGNTSEKVTHSITVTESNWPDDFSVLTAEANEGTYTATFAWEKSSDDSGAVTYEIRLTSYDDDGEESTLSFKTSSTRYVTPALQAGYYDYVIRAVDKYGNYTESWDSGTIDIMDITAPTAGSFTVVQTSGDYALDVTWDAFKDNVGVCYYDLYVNGESWDSVGGDCPDEDGKFRTTLWLDEEYLGKTVTVGMCAVDYEGNESAMSTSKYRLHSAECPEDFGELSGVQKSGGYTAVLSWEKSTGGAGGITYDIILTTYDEEGETVSQTFHSAVATYTTPSLALGDYEFTVIAKDKLGNCTEGWDTGSFTISDITAVPAGDFAVTQLPNGEGFQFVFTGYSENVGIESFVISVDGEEDSWVSLEELTVNDQGQLYCDVSLSCWEPGSYTIGVVAVDAIGNESGKVIHKLQVKEMDSPEDFGDFSAEQNTGKYTAKLCWGKSSDVSGVTYEVIISGVGKNGEEYTTSIRTPYTSITTPVLPAGDYVFNVIAYDKNGNYTEGSDYGAFEIVDITAPESGSFTVTQVSGDFALQVRWNAFKDNVGVDLYELFLDGAFSESVGVDCTEEDGSYAAILQLDDSYFGKTVTVSMRALDEAGNEGPLSKVTYKLHEIECPTSVTELSLTQQGSGNAVELTWRGSSDNAGVSHYLVMVDDDRSTAVSVKGTSCRLDGLAYGVEQWISVVAVDVNGNESDAVYDHVFIEDVESPVGGTVEVVQDGGELVVSVCGFVDNDCIAGYDVYVDGELVDYQDGCDEDGNAQPSKIFRLALSWDDIGVSRTVSVTAVDKSGNESDAVSAAVTVVRWSEDDGTSEEQPECIEGLTAAVTGDSAVISWDVPADRQDVVGYRVYVDHGLELSAWEREEEETGEMVPCWEHSGGYVTSSNSYSVTGLSAGGHYVWVEAELSDGSWLDSGYGYAFEVADTEAPKAGEFTASQSDYGYSIDLSWTGFTDNFAIAGYSVRYQSSEIELSCEQSELSLWCFSEDDIGKTVVFTIRAWDYAGNVSGEISKIVTIVEAEEGGEWLVPGEIEIHWDWSYPAVIAKPVYYDLYLEGSDEPIRLTDPVYHLCVEPDWSEKNYRIEAYDGNGVSIGDAVSGKVVSKADSADVPAQEQADVIAPMPGIVSLSQAADSCDVTVTWSRFTDNKAVTAYRIVADGVEILLQASDLSIGNDGSYHWVWELGDERAGEKVTLSLQGLDDAGNASLAVTSKCQLRDVTPPSAVTDLVAEQLPGQGVAVLTWTPATDNSDKPEDSGIAGYIVTIDGVGHRVSEAAYKTDTLAVGSHRISIAAEDKAGNLGTAVSSEFEIRDFTAPVKGCISLLRGNGDYDIDVKVESFRDNVGISSYNVYIDGELSQVISLDDIDSYAEKCRSGAASRTVCHVVDGMTARPGGGCRFNVQFDITQAGRHSIGISAVDDAGNESEIATRLVSIQDVTAPDGVRGVSVAGSTDLRTAVVSWTAASDNSDSGVQGSGIQYYLVSLDYGKWSRFKGTSATFRSISDGTHCVRVKAVDASGNQSQESEAVKFIVADGVVDMPDVTAPTAGSISLAQAGDSCEVTITWSGFADETGVAGYKVIADGSEYLLSASEVLTEADGICQWTLKLLPERTGDYVYVTVHALDAAGNQSDGASAGCRLEDVFAPEAGVVSLEQTSEDDGVLLSWRGFTDNVAVTAYRITAMGDSFTLNARNLSPDADGACHWLLPVDHDGMDGTVDVSVQAIDGAGNISEAVSASCQLRDMTPPDAVTGLSGKQLAHQSAYQFSWNPALDNGGGGISEYVVTIDGVSYATGQTSYTTGALSLGMHTFSVVARDMAGNLGADAAELRFRVADYTAPTAGTLWFVRGSGDYDVVFRIRNFSDDVGIDSYKVYVDGQLWCQVSSGDVSVQSGVGSLSVALSAVHAGIRALGISAVDAAGNESAVVSKSYRVADVTAPEVVTGLTAAKVSGTAQTVVSWDVAHDNSDGAEPGSGIDHYLVSLDGGKWSSCEDTSITYARLSDGVHRVQVVAVDYAGNRSDVQEALTFLSGQTRGEEFASCVAQSSCRSVGIFG